MELTLRDVLFPVFGIVAAILGWMALHIFQRISDDIKSLSENVSKLNERIAVVIEKVQGHEERIRKLEHNGE